MPWIRDHQLKNDIVFPAAGYICMAGEACRQLSNTDDFTVQNVLIKNALVVREGATVEIMTTLRPSRLTDSLDSEWYDFAISSFNAAWMTHCSGQVKAGGENKTSVAIESFHRSVSTPYEDMRSVGLNYGPTFRALKNVTVEPGFKTASATILAPSMRIQDSYQIHPTSMDCCLQLFMTAACEGISRRQERLFVPTKIEELYVGKFSPHADLLARAKSVGDSAAVIGGHAIATTHSGEVVLSLKGGIFLPVDSEEDEEDTVAAAAIVWKPDIDLIGAETLIHPRQGENTREDLLLVEELCVMCIVEMQYCLPGISATLPHLEQLRSWLDAQLLTTTDDDHLMNHVSVRGKHLTSAGRRAQIDILREQVKTGEAAAIANLVLRVFDNCEDLFRGTISPLDILLPDDGLTRFYNVLESRSDHADFIFYLGHCNPSLRILEIGAGTGGTSAEVLNSLITPNGTRLYSKYWY